MPFKFLPPSSSAPLFLPVQFSPHKHCKISGVTHLPFHQQARPTALLGYILALNKKKKKKIRTCLEKPSFPLLRGICEGVFFFFFPVSISHMPSKMHPFFCARTKNCLRVGQGMGGRKPKELTITRILDSCML